MEYFKQFDLSPFYDRDLWRGPAFTGTNFVGYPAAIMILFVGESFRGTWLLYSSLCLFGLFFLRKFFTVLTEVLSIRAIYIYFYYIRHYGSGQQM